MNSEKVDADVAGNLENVAVKEIPDQEVKNIKGSAFNFEEIDFGQILSELKQSSSGLKKPKQYEDKGFTPSGASICADQALSLKYKYSELKWKRLAELQKYKNAKLFDGPAGPHNILQGNMPMN